jgi:hypothetical protein
VKLQELAEEPLAGEVPEPTRHIIAQEGMHELTIYPTLWVPYLATLATVPLSPFVQ